MNNWFMVSVPPSSCVYVREVAKHERLVPMLDVPYKEYLYRETIWALPWIICPRATLSCEVPCNFQSAPTTRNSQVG